MTTNRFVKILDWNTIPKNLLLFTEDKIKSQFDDHSPYDWYQQFRQFKINNADLAAYLQPNFKFDITDRMFYQIIRSGIATHIDTGRVIIYNYLLDTGGDNVYTVWFEDDQVTEQYKIKLPAFTWHSLDVSIPHTVTGIETTRIAISIFESVNTARYYD